MPSSPQSPWAGPWRIDKTRQAGYSQDLKRQRPIRGIVADDAKKTKAEVCLVWVNDNKDPAMQMRLQWTVLVSGTMTFSDLF